MIASFTDQSSAADWDESVELSADDGATPLWSTIPADLVVTLTIIPEVNSLRSDYGDVATSVQSAVISASSNDLTGRVALSNNGIIRFHIAASEMSALAPDNFSAMKRHLVFVRYQIASATLQGLVGILPVYRGI